MKHLANRMYLAPLEYISSHIHKVVIGRGVTESFVDYHEDTLGKTLDPEVPRTLFYSPRVEHFMEHRFTSLFETLLSQSVRIRWYLDDEATVRLHALWLRALFPSLTFENYLAFIRTDIIDRLGTDLTFRVNSPFYTAPLLRRVFDRTPVDHALTKLMSENWSSLSVEYRLIAALRGYHS